MSPHARSLARSPSMRRRLVRLVSALAVLVASIAAPGSARAADLNATPATLASVYASAQGGDVIHLAAGSYGSFAGGSKSSVVTLVAQAGVVATIEPEPRSGSVNNLRFDGLTIDGRLHERRAQRRLRQLEVHGPGARRHAGQRVQREHRLRPRHASTRISATATSYEGRLTVRGYDNSSPVGVKITNSHFGNGGCSDGVQIVGDAYGVQVGPGNEFSGIRQGACAAHVDSIQLYGSQPHADRGQLLPRRRHDHHGPRWRRERGHRRQRDGRRRLRARGAAGQPQRHPVRPQHGQVDRRVHGRTSPARRRAPTAWSATTSFVNGYTNAPARATARAAPWPTTSSTAAGAPAAPTRPSATPGVRRRRQPDAATPATSWPPDRRARPTPATATTSARASPAAPPPPPPTDTTAPDTTITSGPTGTTNDSTPTFAFTSSEADSVFECRVDSGVVGRLHEPVDDARAERRAALGRRPRDGRGGQHRRLARDALVHGRPRRRRRTPRRPTRRSRRARRARRTTATPDVRLHRQRGQLGLRVPRRLRGVGDCASPWTTPALSDGPHSVSVRATDVAGNTDASPATRSFTVATAPPPDTTAPETTIPSGPTGTTSDSTPTFAFALERARLDLRVPRRLRGVGELHQPVDDGRAERRPARRVGPRDGRGGQHRRLARDALVHGRGRAAARHHRADTTITSGPSATTSATNASFAFTLERDGLDIRVQARLGRLRGLHEPEGLQRPERRGAHLQRARHRRGGQHGRHAGDAELDDPGRAARRPPAGRRLHLQPGLAGHRPGGVVRRLERDVRRHAVHVHVGRRRPRRPRGHAVAAGRGQDDDVHLPGRRASSTSASP